MLSQSKDLSSLYDALYESSLKDPEMFWGDVARDLLDWMSPFTKVKNTSFKGNVSIKWFEDGTLNAAYNCLDRHLETRGEKLAYIWWDEAFAERRTITYRELQDQVSRFASGLKSLGLTKRDRVIIYMPLMIEAIVAMLACARIGAIHSVVFGGFSAKALHERIQDCGAKLVITTNESLRGGKIIPTKANVDEAISECPTIQNVVVVQRTKNKCAWNDKRDHNFDDIMKTPISGTTLEEMNAEDPLFILYTSGSTGKPKGVVHTTGGYLTYAAHTHATVFNLRKDDIYWCTADIGWITGHSYVVYGPLLNGATTVLFEGTPLHPNSSVWWDIIDREKVSIFYTAPTAIRTLMKEGDEVLAKSLRTSLRLLGTVGEPINHEAWTWYFDMVGHQNSQIMDTWWQTETGGIMISAIPEMTASKPGSASKPFYGIAPVLLDAGGTEIMGEGEGNLAIKESWPGQARTLWGDHERFIKTYFSTYPGYYFTGDGSRRDSEGDYWITGRVDDVINVSGHRLGTAEIEDAIDSHWAVVESAVVGIHHDVKGQGLYAYVTLKHPESVGNDLKKEIIQHVRSEIGPIATLDQIQWAPNLPKTRSGKIMRRILRKIAENDLSNLGDISTLADPQVVEDLIAGRAGLR
ncbi:Acetate--CoA ligase [Candidatus Bealeia paramacronuclearis]|uniref:Acetate--CoA ligase n=1 Tax=Candidatus Bealeia paramacronuclearis TaxID=1921001 RepID=A0ABZ2C548_9PROT|nr:Acetate--CoA ligase [Candidatus Bealeia paramacronuclearis]